MAISIEIRGLVDILNSQGLGLISGELLSELASPAEFDEGDDGSVGARLPTSLDLEGSAIEQLSLAIAFLKIRLVQPALHLAEAERIAGNISASAAVRIRFVNEENQETLTSDHREPPGQVFVEKLDDVLNRIARSKIDGT